MQLFPYSVAEESSQLESVVGGRRTTIKVRFLFFAAARQ